MTGTLVIQSHRHPLPYKWLQRCIESVKTWSEANQFDYRWLDDELFEPVAPELLEKTRNQRVVASDLGRLYAIRKALESHRRVIWLDADFLIFKPESFRLPAPNEPPLGYLLGREVWVQHEPTAPKKLKAYIKVHNAFLLFDRDNSFLDFYLDHALQLLCECSGPIPPQFLGPKLLTAIHNVIGCPVMETAGMLSPMVINDLLSEGESCYALNLMQKRSKSNLAGANLCSSVVDQSADSERKMHHLIDLLLSSGDLI